MGEWLGLSPVVRGSRPWHNLSAKSTLNQVTGTPTLHDSDAWLLSVTGGPGNEHRQGVEALEGGEVTSKRLGSKRRPHARR